MNIKKGKQRTIIFIIIYLIFSSMFIFVHIDRTPIYYENYDFETVGNFYNIVRLIMGIPTTSNGYIGISPIYSIEIIIKLALSIVLLIYLIIQNIKNKKMGIVTQKNFEIENFIMIICTILISFICIIIYLIYLYIIYININYI